MLQNIIT